MNKDSYIEMIANGKVKAVLTDLLSRKNLRPDLMDEVVIISNSYWRLKNDFLQGQISQEDRRIELNRLSRGLLQVVRTIGDNDYISMRDVNSSVRRIEIKISMSIEDFSESETDNFVSTLSTLLALDKEKIKLIDIYRGSVIILLELPARDAERLDSMLKLGALDERYHILDVSLIDTSSIQTESSDDGSFTAERTGENEELSIIIQEVINENPIQVREYLNGKRGLLGFLMGVVMKKTRGQANPEKILPILESLLDKVNDK